MSPEHAEGVKAYQKKAGVNVPHLVDLVTKSTGSPDAGNIPVLDASGRLDSSTIPAVSGDIDAGTF